MPHAIETVDLQEFVRLLRNEVNEGINERRAEKREPFFHPITLVSEKDQQRPVTCFSRDISANNIGLLHFTPIEPGEAVLTIPSKSWGNVDVRSEIVWCRPCGEGWYLCRARLVEIIASA